MSSNSSKTSKPSFNYNSKTFKPKRVNLSVLDEVLIPEMEQSPIGNVLVDEEYEEVSEKKS